MGMLTNEPKTEITNHFSHKHPLKLINRTTLDKSSSCAGCKFPQPGLIYSCTICPFFLHKKCFEMSKQINHPCHKAHPFTLLPKPVYSSGVFRCDACGEYGNGFSYHCEPCGVDLHILCVSAPSSLTHVSHEHKLDLAFESPYASKGFGCNICKRDGFNLWVYRCDLCGFDAHLRCVNPLPTQPAQPPPQLPQLAVQLANFTSFEAYLNAFASPSQSANLTAYLNNVAQPPQPTNLTSFQAFLNGTAGTFHNNMQNNTFVPPINGFPAVAPLTATQYSTIYNNYERNKALEFEQLMSVINNGGSGGPNASGGGVNN